MPGTRELTVRVALRFDPLNEPEIVAEVEKTTMLVFTVNVAVVDPAATVTLGGTVAADVLLLERETTAPPLGAGPFRVTVPVEGKPPVTVVGFSVSEERTGGITVSEAVLTGPSA